MTIADDPTLPQAPAPAADPRKHDYAIVVGISRYPHFTKLDGPENDAQDFYDWVTSDQGGGVPAPNRAKLIRSSDFAQEDEPTTEAVNKAFMDVLEPALNKGGKAGRRLYLYFAGHGFGPKLDESALFMANANSGMGLGYHIAGRRYAEWVAASSLFDEVVLFMDCCRDMYRRGRPNPPPWPPVEQPPGARWLYAFATQWGFKSYERPTPGAQRVEGIFTKSLLTGLRKAVVGGRITAQSLKDFIINDFASRTEQGEKKDPDIDARHAIVFAEGVVPVGAKVTVTFLQPQNQTIQLQDAKLTVLASGPDSAPLVVEGLEPGLYKVVAVETAREKDFQVTSEEELNVVFP